MKQIIIALFLIIFTVGLIVTVFTINQVNNETDRLQNDMIYRSTLLAKSLKESIEPNFTYKSQSYLQYIVNKFTDKERFAGLGVFDNKDNVIAFSSTIPNATSGAQPIVSNAMDSDQANGEFTNFGKRKVYALAVPLHNDSNVVGALLVVQNAGYIDSQVSSIWKNNVMRFFIQALLISLAVLLIIRWIIYEPIRSLVETLKMTRYGNRELNTKGLNNFFLRPLRREITNMQQSLIQARLEASEEAKASLEKLDSPWTAERLKQFVKDLLKDREIIVVSDAEPYIHIKDGNKIKYYVPASGLVTAIEPVMQSMGGRWIAKASGDADKLVVDKNDEIKVPPENPKYTLRRVWLTKEEEAGYYKGLAKEGLWPLLHMTHTRPIFRKEDWEDYKKVNGKFAQVILSEIKTLQNPVIFIQDFHFSLLPRMIKNSRPDVSLGLFWHIPWINAEAFSICPWKKEILDGMLGADLIGFQTQLHCNNFIESVGRELECLIDFEQNTISRNQHTSVIKSFPISVGFSNSSKQKSLTEEEKLEKKKILNNLGIKSKYIGVGVDRLDYTKGILERIKAIEIFLTKYPSYRGDFTFIQISAPARSIIKKYQEFAEEVENEIERVNNLFKRGVWKPIIFIKKNQSHEEVSKYYKLANFCLVTSLHDGMNLVSKEFVAAREDQLGVLILSQFTGSSRELKEAIIINPYNGDQTADAIHRALTMSSSEQAKRMKKLRETVRNNNVYRWTAEYLKTITRIE